MQIIGVCRFSYLATRGWKTTVADDIRATSKKLFTKDRMEERFALFEAVCLPSILAQTDQNFRFMVVASPRMPAEYRERLEALAAPHDTVVVQYLRPRLMPEAVKLGLRRTLDPEAPGPLVQFCLDDDDAVSIHYIARLRAALTGVLASPMAEKLPLAYNQPRGITLSKAKGKFEAHENFAPFLALGLALVTDLSVPVNCYTVPHRKTPTRFMSMLDPEPMTYIRGLHDHHDSKGISLGRVHGLSEERLAGFIETDFPFLSREKITEVFESEVA